MIDALTQESYLFEEFTSVSNHTMPSVVSLLTSRYPSVHRWGIAGSDESKTVVRDLVTWQNLMRRAGYVTLTVYGNDVLNYAFARSREFPVRNYPNIVPVRSSLLRCHLAMTAGKIEA